MKSNNIIIIRILYKKVTEISNSKTTLYGIYKLFTNVI